jgi:integrase
VDSPDLLVTRIKAGELDKFISFMNREGYAPKSIWGYVSSVKSYYGYEEVELDDRKFKKTVRLPVKTEISLDRIPTRQEVRDLLINTNARGRALVALLCTSGVRIGEASNLRIGNVDLEKLVVTVLGTRSKSKKTRITFISKETAQFIREYLGPRVDKKDEWLFPNEDDPSQPLDRNALASAIHRLLEKRGLLLDYLALGVVFFAGLAFLFKMFWYDGEIRKISRQPSLQPSCPKCNIPMPIVANRLIGKS